MTPLARVRARLFEMGVRFHNRRRGRYRRCDECHHTQPGSAFAEGSTTCTRCEDELATPRRA